MEQNDLLRLIGLCKKAGRLEVGEEPVGSACRARDCRLLLIAADAADNTVRRARRLAGEKVPLVQLPQDKGQVGFALGRASCAVLAVTDPGLAALALAKLAGEDEERYAQTAALLERRAQQARKRSGTQKPGDAGQPKARPGKRAKHGSVD